MRDSRTRQQDVSGVFLHLSRRSTRGLIAESGSGSLLGSVSFTMLSRFWLRSGGKEDSEHMMNSDLQISKATNSYLTGRRAQFGLGEKHPAWLY